MMKEIDEDEGLQALSEEVSWVPDLDAGRFWISEANTLEPMLVSWFRAMSGKVASRFLG